MSKVSEVFLDNGENNSMVIGGSDVQSDVVQYEVVDQVSIVSKLFPKLCLSLSHGL